MARRCFIMVPKVDEPPVLAMVTEGEPGYAPLPLDVGYDPTNIEALPRVLNEIAHRENAALGLTDEDVKEIVWSSFHAQKGRRER